MKLTLISTSVMLIVWLFLAAAAVYLIYLIMKALRKVNGKPPTTFSRPHFFEIIVCS